MGQTGLAFSIAPASQCCIVTITPPKAPARNALQLEA